MFMARTLKPHTTKNPPPQHTSQPQTTNTHPTHPPQSAHHRKQHHHHGRQPETAPPRTTQIGKDLADGAAPLSRVHNRLINGDLRLPPGALVVIDDAATATPAAIADLSQHAADIGCTLILLDSSDTRWPPGASARMLDLLESELPWTVSLTRDPDIPRTRHPRPPDLDPILTQATHLDEAVLTPELREFRRRHDQVHATNKQTYERHLTITRIRSRGRDNGLDRSYDAGIDLG
jgi:hypothetical protein